LVNLLGPRKKRREKQKQKEEKTFGKSSSLRKEWKGSRGKRSAISFLKEEKIRGKNFVGVASSINRGSLSTGEKDTGPKTGTGATTGKKTQ